ncbi:hypothetical protein IJD44_03740 [bacterium]|nr:hypothetical protein [bacterium]
MRVSSSNNHSKGVNRQMLRSAKTGALLTGGMIAASQAYHWIAQPDTMRKVVLDNGGAKPYLKNFALVTLLYSALGAVFSAIASKIADKVSPIENPKAVN